jgi:hypothetical protein
MMNCGGGCHVVSSVWSVIELLVRVRGTCALNVGVNLNLERMMRRRILKIVWPNIAVWLFLL